MNNADIEFIKYRVAWKIAHKRYLLFIRCLLDCFLCIYSNRNTGVVVSAMKDDDDVSEEKELISHMKDQDIETGENLVVLQHMRKEYLSIVQSFYPDIYIYL